MHVFFVDPDYHQLQLGPHARLACTDCHPREQVSVVPHQPVSPVDCTRECHLAAPRGIERRFTHASIAGMLERSVHPAELLAKLNFTGGPLLEPGQAVCLYCHDEPLFRQVAVPALPTRGNRTFDRCEVCHREQVPVDVNYYLRHVSARLRPARPPLEMAQLCGVCHADPLVFKPFGMSNAIIGYTRSFHGKAALLGATNTAGCVDCHVALGENAHLMLGPQDPRSSVNPAHVANSCRTVTCHPGADKSIGAASVHLDLPTARATLEFWLAAAFIILTLLTFGPSLVLTLLEIFQIVIGRHHEGRLELRATARRLLASPEGRRRLMRFTVSQRVQHWVLVVLFVLLALTGFPLKFADREWARALIDFFGGLRYSRLVHHWAGIALVIGFIVHLIYALTALRRPPSAPGAAPAARPGLIQRILALPMVISPGDLRKASQQLLYLVGLRTDPPTFGRFSIREKFEYIGVAWGTTLLGVTGLILWGAQIASHYVTGRVLNIAIIAHTYEAFLAIIHVGILHIYSVTLNPHVFPLSGAMLSGNTPVRELADAHGEVIEQAARDLNVPPEEGR